MRRSICTCDPHTVIAGSLGNYRFSYTTANDLPKGTKFIFEIQSEGKPTDWAIPESNIKKKSNIIWAEVANKKIQAKNIDIDKFEFTSSQNLRAGDNFVICLGSPDNDPKKGNLSQKYVQRKKLFNLHIITKEKKETEVFHLDVKGNALKFLKIITPSYVSRNKRFDVIVRFEDEFGNLTNNAPEDTLIELSYKHLRENLSWKLFIPETGFITLPSLYFNEAGVYKIQLKNLKTNQTYYSSPIKCFQDSDLNLFWGLLHGESQRYDTTKNIDSCLRHFRDDKAISFYATSYFDTEKETPNDLWKKASVNTSEFNEDDRFTVFLGVQWKGDVKEEGLRQFIFAKDNKPILRKDDLKSNSLTKIYKTYTPKDLISIPCFTMGKETLYDFKNFNEDYERIVEIYNAWGCSECTEKENNLRPIKGSKKTELGVEEGSIQKALLKGCRFGFVAGGLDDRGVYSSFYDSDQKQYSPGLTGIIAKNHTRDAMFQALYNRSCYATTGAKIIVGLYIAEQPIGSELSTFEKPGLVYNRFISGFVIGTQKITKVEILRNNEVINTMRPDTDTFEFSFDDFENITKISIKLKEDKPPFIYYYLRAYQEDGHIAWSSPIWVDYKLEGTVKKSKKNK